MDDETDWRLASDWYSPTRLHDSPVKYDFPGDRFIPSRSLMDLDQAHGALTNATVAQPTHTKSSIEYRKSLSNLTLNAEGRPFQMLVFRGSPKSSRKLNPMIDETRCSNNEALTCRPLRRFPKVNVFTRSCSSFPLTITSLSCQGEARILDAPRISHDYYLNVIDWGKTNLLAAALDRKLYLWNANTCKVELVSEASEGDYLASVNWSENGEVVAAGYSCSKIHLYDAESLHLVRLLEGQRGRVGSIAWNGHTLTCGSSSGAIINHDVRVRNSQVCRVKVHKGEVSGLKWSAAGSMLASGANDTRICGLQWNRHHKELLSGHGYGYECQNQLCLWKYPSMSRIGESANAMSRVLHLTQSPDGLTVASAGEDEALRFWNVFGPAPPGNSRMSYLESLLSLKTSAIR
ncbi:hypothetical protein SASPL_120731 [Salvia splendens]|uniref:Anaphase-promoting complex subunit 4-like WD40 domain-containing protein n=1 Tax=Salvia splendens TaxID=180675 RepID=A0A8X8ZVG7_SALSN|nr:hypothetical protein SASPL_120731 [Salvia splendens]